MIRHLTLKDVGPARDLKFAFSPRLNVLTGDNGLGKTFVLDVLWWVLTTQWVGHPAYPYRPPTTDGDVEPEVHPKIRANLDHRRDGLIGVETGGDWSWQGQSWERPQWAPTSETQGPSVYPEQHDEAEHRPRSVVLYARIDGSFAIWDSYYVKGGISNYKDAFIPLSSDEVWDGKEVPDGRGGKRTVIRGLVADWVTWQQSRSTTEFQSLRRVLDALSPPDEPLVPGPEPVRVDIQDRRDIPTLESEFGVVPVTLASAGMRRALALAYLLVWAWTEHKKAADAIKERPSSDIVLLVDEPELHLHPGWQRTFLPAVLKAVSMTAPNAGVQVFAATHSPLVLASLESAWVEEHDDLFVLERSGRLIRVEELPFTKEGDVSAWLDSRVFGGVSGRSRAGELAIDAAQHFMADRSKEAEDTLRTLYDHLDKQPHSRAPDVGDFDLLVEVAEDVYRQRPLPERVHDALKHTLPGHDEFWVHWTLVYRPGRRSKEDGDAAR